MSFLANVRGREAKINDISDEDVIIAYGSLRINVHM